jgi:prolipoprotein diacylglyceryltransferase
VPIAAIALDFDPVLDLGGVTVRLQAIALTAGILLSLAWTALAARRSGLRADDLLFLAVAAVPGAVIAGRLGHVLDHADFYAANPGAVLDPAQGSVTLALAVAGGALTAGIIARLLGAPVRAWLHLAAVPTLLAIAIGKLAMVLSGSGQGRPTDDSWATTYVGPGPWGSLAPDVASHPSQVYEALVALAIASALALALATGVDRARSGRVFLAGVGLWAVGRAAIGATWRDAAVLGPLGAEQLQALAVAAASLLLLLVPVPEPANRGDGPVTEEGAPAWPDPVTRPRF